MHMPEWIPTKSTLQIRKLVLVLNRECCFSLDNTNTKESSLYKYVDIARSTGYHVVLVEPKTSWKYNIFELALKNHHKVSEEVLRELLSEFHQTIAVYYGWFLSESSARTLKDRMFEVLNDCCVRIPSFKDDLITTMASQQTQYESQGKFL